MATIVKTGYEFRNDIKAELLESFADISGHPYPEDYLGEIADDWTPIYNGDVIEVWHKSMPSEFVDSWQEIGANENDGIISRMRVDLYLWLNDLTREIWEEVKNEQEEEN